MLTYYNNYVPLVQLKTINMPRQARKTSGTGILPRNAAWY